MYVLKLNGNLVLVLQGKTNVSLWRLYISEIEFFQKLHNLLVAANMNR